MGAGTLSFSAPLRERCGKVIAAMSFASHRSSCTPEDLSANVFPQFQQAASRVEATNMQFSIPRMDSNSIDHTPFDCTFA